MNYSKSPKSVGEFIQIINEINGKWTQEGNEKIYPWFRGHCINEHLLVPGAYRTINAKKNQDSYRQDFQKKAFPFLNEAYGLPKDDWEWYFLMQHYGLPTRLLDWSEGSLIALYFAIK